jgi:hypothetical protein
MSEFENFLDLENYGIAVLTDEEGNEIEFEKQAIVPYEGKLYAVLTTPVNPAEDEEVEIAVFEVEEVEGEVSLTLADDDAVYDEVLSLLLNADDDEDVEETEGEEE